MSQPRIVVSEDASNSMTPSAAIPIDPPKLKGRQRLLQGLQRISSSSSLARMGKPSPSSTPVNGYNGQSRGSVSCMSLTTAASPSNYGHNFNNSYASQWSAQTQFSTAPTSLASTPGEMRFLNPKLREGNRSRSGTGTSTPLTAPLPQDVKVNSSGGMHTAPLIPGVHDDYFSIPIRKATTIQYKRKFDFWREMPDEIKVQIFSFLKPKEIVRCSIVSKAWHKMCFDGQLWGELNASEFYKDIPSDSLVKIMTRAGPFVRELNLRGCVQMREKWSIETPKITEQCRNLEYFSIEGCRIDRSSVHFFLLRNPRLVHINLSGLTALNNAAMKIIAQNCPQLEYLNVAWCQHIDTKGLLQVIKDCRLLKDLRAGEIKGWNDEEFLLALFETNNLERLLIPRCTDFDDNSLSLLMVGKEPEMDLLAGRAIVPPRKFQHLDFSRNSALTAKSLKLLAHNVPSLVGLQLTECALLNDTAFTTLLPTAPHLTHLDLEELPLLTNTTLLTLSTSPCAPNLRHLSLSYCELISDTGVLPLLKSTPSLSTIDLDNTRISDLCLAEAAAMLRARNRAATTGNASGKPEVSLRMAVYDCVNVTWTGVREILSRNAEFYRLSPPTLLAHPHKPTYPKEVIALKCFYGFQPTVDEHLKRVLRGELARATILERKWAGYMIASEEVGGTGAGYGRRRRRQRVAGRGFREEVDMDGGDEEEGGVGRNGMEGGRRRARSGGCVVM
jgi:F-box/leucine-rich repeat protein 2/20